MLETDTEKNSSYGSKHALPRAGEQKNVPVRNFNMIFRTAQSEARQDPRKHIFTAKISR